MSSFHTPVMVEEVLNALNVTPGENYIDATVGGGGHSEAILRRGGNVLGIDHDPEAIAEASKRLLAAYPPASKRGGPGGATFALNVGNFSHLREFARNSNFTPVAGILFDLGVSSFQLTHPQRGFSFAHEADLDMRMDPTLEVSAKDLVNALSEKELTLMLRTLTQERHARKIAKAMVTTRQVRPITTTAELANVVAGVYPPDHQRKLHPATRTFLALRMAVNLERENLETALPEALDLLKVGGHLVVLSFHETEDRIVKQFFKQQKLAERITLITKKPMTPTLSEKAQNPNARSAKLRVARKIRN